jgi:hypothetical protein
MAVTSKEIGATVERAGGRGEFAPMLRAQLRTLAAVITGVLAVLALYVLMSAAVDWAQVTIDDLRYGRPRAMHVNGFVGHAAEAAGQPTHFVALNLDRQVMVLEIPGGDQTQVRSYAGPYLFGAQEDLTPVLLSLHDIDGDGYNDLLIDVRNERVIYLNRDGSFRLPNAEEQQLLMQEHQP